MFEVFMGLVEKKKMRESNAGDFIGRARSYALTGEGDFRFERSRDGVLIFPEWDSPLIYSSEIVYSGPDGIITREDVFHDWAPLWYRYSICIDCMKLANAVPPDKSIRYNGILDRMMREAAKRPEREPHRAGPGSFIWEGFLFNDECQEDIYGFRGSFAIGIPVVIRARTSGLKLPFRGSRLLWICKYWGGLASMSDMIDQESYPDKKGGAGGI